MLHLHNLEHSLFPRVVIKTESKASDWKSQTLSHSWPESWSQHPGKDEGSGSWELAGRVRGSLFVEGGLLPWGEMAPLSTLEIYEGRWETGINVKVVPCVQLSTVQPWTTHDPWGITGCCPEGPEACGPVVPGAWESKQGHSRPSLKKALRKVGFFLFPDTRKCS